ncbi:hypothetical protein LTR85_009354 [Meristemomyces frigidus]|nr:hypothetical protein LTR85_009354 [Meristemomyces frigidus]
MNDADAQPIQHVLHLATWFDLCHSLNVAQSYADLNLLFPDLGANARGLLIDAVRYAYQRLRPTQEDVNALWMRVRSTGLNINAHDYLPVNLATGESVALPQIFMEDHMALHHTDEDILREKLAQLAVAKFARELVRHNLYRAFEGRLADLGAARQMNDARRAAAATGTDEGEKSGGGAQGHGAGVFGPEPATSRSEDGAETGRAAEVEKAL